MGMDMGMGWWHPYFFIETEGVQLLFSGLQVKGTGTLLLYSLLLFAVCAFDRCVCVWLCVRVGVCECVY